MMIIMVKKMALMVINDGIDDEDNLMTLSMRKKSYNNHAKSCQFLRNCFELRKHFGRQGNKRFTIQPWLREGSVQLRLLRHLRRMRFKEKLFLGGAVSL